jgi:hypothetical protein
LRRVACGALLLQACRKFLDDGQLTRQLQLRVLELKKLNCLKIIAAFTVLPWLKALDQNSFHRGYHHVYIHTGKIGSSFQHPVLLDR